MVDPKMLMALDLDEKKREFLEAGVKQTITKIIETITEGLVEGTRFWSLPYKAFYKPHIDIFAELITTEWRYDGMWQTMMKLVHEVDDYRKFLELYLKRFPQVPGIKSDTRELVKNLDYVINGTEELQRRVCLKLKEINKFLAIQEDTKMDLFKLIFVAGKNGTIGKAREDLCYATKQLLDTTSRLIDYRNKWANGLAQRSALNTGSYSLQCGDVF
jgi:hypothetical protein